MGINADIADDWHAALAALAWQVELGAVDAVLRCGETAAIPSVAITPRRPI